MRSFPRAPRSLLLTALVTLVILPGIPAAQADEDTGLRERQKSVQGQIDSTNAALLESSAQASAAGAALSRAETALGGARANLIEVTAQLRAAESAQGLLQVELEQTQAELATAQQELRAGQTATDAQRQRVADTITDVYTQGDPQLLAFASILDARTPADVTRQLGFNDVVVGKQETAYDDLEAVETELVTRQDAVARAEVEVSVRRDAASATVAGIRALEVAAIEAEAGVSSLVSARLVARADARAARDADRAQLRELAVQDERIKTKILRAKAKAKAAAAAARTRTYAGSPQGLVLAPVTGPVTSPYGYRRHPIFGYWGLHDGTDFGVSCGEGLRAAGDGTVLSTSYSSVFGYRLFLDLGIVNGKAITVVYNHAAGYQRSEGDVVQRGDIIGTVGSTGWSTGCHLHFTVLEDGTAVDPMTYL